MRRFVLWRKEDVSGVSGTGLVAEGVEFSDGSVALRWRSSTSSLVFYGSAADCEAVHGHGGATQLLFVDDGDDIERLARDLVRLYF